MLLLCQIVFQVTVPKPHINLTPSTWNDSLAMSGTVRASCGQDVPACMLSHFSCVQLFATLWTLAYQDPLSMGFF